MPAGPPNPYVGPVSIAPPQPLFGRDREVSELGDLLLAERIVLLYSPSGAGKSSLVQAGLKPLLKDQFDVWEITRVGQIPSAPTANRYVWSAISGFENSVNFDPSLTLKQYASGRSGGALNPLLIFDQFEEILRIDPVDPDSAQSAGEDNPKAAFFKQLGEMLSDRSLWALFILREDFLAPLDPYRRLLPTRLQNRYRIDRLTREMAKEAIVGPLRETSQSQASPRTYAPGMVDKLVNNLATIKIQQLDGKTGEQLGDYVEPLQLQVVCRDIWDRMEPGEMVIGPDRVSDIGNALEGYYASNVQSVAAEAATAFSSALALERDIRDWFGKKLISSDGIRNQVRSIEGKVEGLGQTVVDDLVATYLVRAEPRGGIVWYELAHDRFIEPVLRNNELWFAAHLSTIQQRAVQWEREGEPESLLVTGSELAAALRWAALSDTSLTVGERSFLDASRRRRRRLLQTRAAVAIVIAFLVATSALGLIARRERDRAEMNLALAKQAVDESLSSAGREQARESADSPEIEAFRKELLDKAAAFYAVFTREDSGNLKLRTEAAWAHSRLGDVNRLLNRRDVAIAEYRQAIAAFQRLAEQHPKAPEYRQALAYAHNWLGETLRAWLEQMETPDHSVRDEAIGQYDAALGLQQQLHATVPEDRQYIQELARSYYNRGILSFDAGDRQGSESDFRTAIGLLQPIAEQIGGPGTQSSQPAQDLARVENDLAALLEAEGKSGDALILYEQAIQRSERLRAADPEKREYGFELAQYCDNEARLLSDISDLSGADRRNRQALDLVQALANPAPSLSLEELKVLQLRSEISLALGSPDALQESEHERELLDRLQSSAPPQHNPLLHSLYANLAANYVDLAGKELKAGDLQDAQRSLKGLATMLPQLPPEDRTTAEENYLQLQRQLQSRLPRQ